jgi:hypothetical protein
MFYMLYFVLISSTLLFYKFILLQLQMSAVRTCLNLPLFDTNQCISPYQTKGLFYLITVYRLQNSKQNRIEITKEKKKE